MYPENFYSDLPVLNNFIDITDFSNFVAVPHEWYIIITDVVGSTKAIEAGRYKDINLIGACSIIAILNIAGDIEIPFIFGGDGASILIPPSLFAKAKTALLGTQHFAREEFNLELRIGIVPVSYVAAANYEVKIAKLRVSDTYNQGIFTGGGLTYATQLIKDPTIADIFRIQDNKIPKKPDFSGLSCPWQDIISPSGEAISLLVLATANNAEQEHLIYKSVLEEIGQIYGNAEKFHPVIPANIKFSLATKSIAKIVKIQAKSKNYFLRWLEIVKSAIKRYILAFLQKFKINTNDYNWPVMAKSLVDASDYRKFDDMLRMIIAGNTAQREKLMNFLEKNYQAGKLVYGIHVSDRVLMTCLLPLGGTKEVHLVDGADGGYAIAAKEMKIRLRELGNRE